MTEESTGGTPDPAVAEQLVELAQRLRDQAVALDEQRRAPAPRPSQEAAERRTPAPSTSTRPSTPSTDGSAGKAEAERRYGSRS